MAGNKLGFYDPLFYAQEALIVLEKALGFAGRMHRGFDPSPQQKGSTINIRKPASFVVNDAPSTAQDVNTDGVTVTLDQWKEVKFAITDKELTFTKEQIIADHIRPAAYAIADYIDTVCAGLYVNIPYCTGTAGTTPDAIGDLTMARKVMNDMLFPQDGNRHFAINSAAEEKLLQLATFNANGGSTGTTEAALLRGTLGTKFGMEIFAPTNVPDHDNGTLAAGTAIQANANTAKDLTQMVWKDSGGSLAGTLKKGTIFTIAGQTTKYVVTADAEAATNLVTVAFYPGLSAAVTANAVITLVGDHAVNLGFHRNAFCLAMAPLSDLGKNFSGVKMEVIGDPLTNLAIRSRMWYDPDNSKVVVALDVLFGLKTLEPKLAFRYLG